MTRVFTDIQLTPHFHLMEFLQHNGADVLTAEHVANLRTLANRLEDVRTKCGDHPIRITSGFRTPWHNRHIGGAKNSYHLRGMAADIVIRGLPARDVQRLMADWDGGMGCYAGFTHLDIRADRARW